MASKKKAAKGSTPSAIREAMRGHLLDALPELVSIVHGGERDVDRLRAVEILGRFGLGNADMAQLHLHTDGGDIAIGVVTLPMLEPVAGGEPLQAASRALALPASMGAPASEVQHGEPASRDMSEPQTTASEEVQKE